MMLAQHHRFLVQCIYQLDPTATSMSHAVHAPTHGLCSTSATNHCARSCPQSLLRMRQERPQPKNLPVSLTFLQQARSLISYLKSELLLAMARTN
jgi:hypothetical protein